MRLSSPEELGAPHLTKKMPEACGATPAEENIAYLEVNIRKSIHDPLGVIMHLVQETLELAIHESLLAKWDPKHLNSLLRDSTSRSQGVQGSSSRGEPNGFSLIHP
jgi:hypothetical protein